MSRYCIVPYPPTECQLSHCRNQTLESVVKKLDNSECIIKYYGDKHSCLSAYADFNALQIIEYKTLDEGYPPILQELAHDE